MIDEQTTVSVLIITYNHEKFIAQAIESALMQKTNFDFEIVIGEDCSTDKTREIVVDYQNKNPDKIKLLLNERNLGMMQNFIQTLNDCTGKYIALLEGDDYWIDPYKLQKQVDIMESDPEIGLVHTNYNRFYQEFNRIQLNVQSSKNSLTLYGNIFESLLVFNFICTATVLARSELISSAIQELGKKFYQWPVGDLPLWLFISSRKKIAYINDTTSVYRVTRGTASTKDNLDKALRLLDSVNNIMDYFISTNNVSSVTKSLITFRYNKKKTLFGLKFSNNELVRSAIKEILHLKEIANFRLKLKYQILYLFSLSKLSWYILSYLYNLKTKLRLYSYPDSNAEISNCLK